MKVLRDFLARRQGYFIEPGLRPDVPIGGRDGGVREPHVHAFAAFLAERMACPTLIGIGCGVADKLAPMHPGFRIVGVDAGEDPDAIRNRHPFGSWLAWDIDRGRPPKIEAQALQDAVVVCSDVIERIERPERLLGALHDWLATARLAVISTPDRDRSGGAGDGPPGCPRRVRAWTLPEFKRLLSHYELPVEAIGYTIDDTVGRRRGTILAVLKGRAMRPPAPAATPRALAIVASYNDASIIEQVVAKLTREGLDVHVIDNWSTDGTYELVEAMRGANAGVVGCERFPAAPNSAYEWQKLLRRKEELARERRYDWYLHVDSDEVRHAPWKGTTLLEAIAVADREGYNAIDSTVINFYPTDDRDFPERADLETYFRYFDFGQRPGHFKRVNVWKNLGGDVDLVTSGGHEIDFAGKRVYPYKFLIKHYPFLSQRHGEGKIRDRVERSAAEYKTLNWHSHLRLYPEGHTFYRDRAVLAEFTDGFYDDYFVERLSGIGIEIDSRST